jgi:periplasmic protein TonB
MKISGCLGFRSLLLPVLLAVSFVGAGPAQDAPKKVTRNEGLNAVTSKVSPEYPAIARQLKIEGMVELEALVTENGTVEKVNIMSGNPVLTRPASEALKKWKYAPFTTDGKAVKALVPVSLYFKM